MNLCAVSDLTNDTGWARWGISGTDSLQTPLTDPCGSPFRCPFKKNDTVAEALEDIDDAVNPTHICRIETTSDSSR